MIIKSSFKPAWWLRNRHAQTIWPSLFRIRPKIKLQRERIELPDGDFVDLDWTAEQDGPLVILFHGLEGSDQSHYVRGLMQHLSKKGFQTVVMYFRGCSGEVNRLPRAYHSGDTGDISFVTQRLKLRFPQRALYAIGISLGGNALLKWLGESGDKNPLDRAVAISVPFDLSNAARQLNQPESSVYQRHLLNKMTNSTRRKFQSMDLPVDKQLALNCKSIWEYDDRVTAPLHGFTDAEDFYSQSSSKQFLKSIRIPTLILHAKDDPFMTHVAIPASEDLSESVTMELSEHGGHVGFIAGWLPCWPTYWLDQRVVTYFSEVLTA